jgi:peroxiredoxin
MGRLYAEYRERDAEVLAIGPDGVEASAGLVAQLGLPFPLLSDPACATAKRQMGALLARPTETCSPFVVVANRFEEVWAVWAPHDELDLPSQEDVLGWLEFVAIQCHNGCTTPEWELES